MDVKLLLMILVLDIVILSDENMKEIVKTIINFAQKMEYKTIAEFVANEEIFNSVKELGIDYSQGYFIGEPKESL